MILRKDGHADRFQSDFGDINKDRRHTEDSNQHTGMFIPDSRHVDQFVEMPLFGGTGDVELFLQRWSNSEQLFRLKNCNKESVMIVAPPGRLTSASRHRHPGTLRRPPDTAIRRRLNWLPSHRPCGRLDRRTASGGYINVVRVGTEEFGT